MHLQLYTEANTYMYMFVHPLHSYMYYMYYMYMYMYAYTHMYMRLLTHGMGYCGMEYCVLVHKRRSL